MTPKLILLLVISCTLSSVRAGNFVVTSNADSGPGTLREALQMAAANGSAATDSIKFNLPDLSRASRTITLDSTLPALSSNLIIDGTTQPGTAFGISGAKVEITNALSQYLFTFFSAIGVTHIEVYGLFLKGVSNTYAFDFRQINGFQVGKPGMGNLITGFERVFQSDLINDSDSSSYNVTIESNLMGVTEAGDSADYPTYNQQSFYLKAVNNLQIGGLGPGEGNVICDDNLGMNYTLLHSYDSGFVKIENNMIGVDITGRKRLTPGFGDGYFINAFNDGSGMSTSNLSVSVINNVSVLGFYFFKLKNYFRISGNHMGVPLDNITNIAVNHGIMSFQLCTAGIIGGADDSDKNYIAYFGSPVSEYYCGDITISKNSFFCNEIGIDIGWIQSRPKPFVIINSLTPNNVAGTAPPHAIVELFYDDECPGCEGKTYIGSTTADASGNWTYSINNTGGIVATATDTLGATSEFSTATINTDSVMVINATCGKSNGSIKHMRVISGTDWYWQDTAGNIISRNTDLINAPAGSYKFVSSIGGNSCEAKSTIYTITDVGPSFDISLIQVTQPSCGQFTGVLQNTGSFNGNFLYTWVDSANDILSGDFSQHNPFTGLNGRKYFLKVRLITDSTCYVQYGPFVLTNQSGPSLQTDHVTIGNATCGQNNGFIKGFTYSGATGTSHIVWEDSIGKVVSNSIDLTGAGKGRYRLKFKDGSACDTITTPYYTIADAGTITIDTSNMSVKASSCRGTDGSITDITATSATSFSWLNVSTGATVGNNMDVFNLGTGIYRLHLANNLGCTAETGPIKIGQSGFLTLVPINVSMQEASCLQNNGSIDINSFSRDPSYYKFTWLDSSSNAVISNVTVISSLAPGTYLLNATDSNGCSETVYTGHILQTGKPAFDYSSVSIKSDTCNSGDGSIQDLRTMDSAPAGIIRTYSWMWYDGQQLQVSTTPGNLYSLKQGNYYATITDQFNCTVTSNIFTVDDVEVTPGPPAANDLYIPRNTSATIAVVNPRAGNYELLNDDQPGSPPLASSQAGVFETPVVPADRSYYIRYTTGDCNSSLAKVNIKVFDSTILYIPNAFTPNSDGVNDRLHVTVQGVVNRFTISIYNRWGSLVYQTNNPSDSWDGTLKGVPVPEGVFVFIVNAVDYRNRPISQRGTVVLIR